MEQKKTERINRILTHPSYIEYVSQNAEKEQDRVFCHHDMGHFLDVARLAEILNLTEAYGQDAELMACKNILDGTQTTSIFKNTALLADKCVTMVEAVMKGTEPEINDTTTYDNGKIVVPSYLCTPISVDKDNLKQIVVDESGYYTAEELGL